LKYNIYIKKLDKKQKKQKGGGAMKVLILGEIVGDIFYHFYGPPRYYLVEVKKEDEMYKFYDEEKEVIFEARTLKGINLDSICGRVLGEYWDTVEVSQDQDIITFELWLENEYSCRISRVQEF
jgi:hypothetical protein